jgi:hypothetical protein
MNKKSMIMMRLIVGLTLLTMGCQTIGGLEILGFGEATPTPIPWPHSTFVPPRKSVQVAVGQALQIDSYHLSPERLDKVEIFVNGQPIKSEDTAAADQAAIFPGQLVNVQVLSEQGLVQASRVQPEFPSAAETVSLIWVSYIPGTYDLSLIATDTTGHKGQPIVQRIEVR